MAKAPRQKKPTHKPVPVWLWLLNLVAASGFVYFLYHLKNLPDAPPPAPAARQTPPASTAPSSPKDQAPAQATSRNSPRFEFYDMLPKTEVNPAPVEAYTPKKARQNYDYILQTGSFRNREDAERQKATIAFQGMRAEIREVQGENGVRYRVQIGPISNRSTMNKAVDRLVAINIQPLVRKVKRETQ